jgi:hypothetical protein
MSSNLLRLAFYILFGLILPLDVLRWTVIILLYNRNPSTWYPIMSGFIKEAADYIEVVVNAVIKLKEETEA